MSAVPFPKRVAEHFELKNRLGGGAFGDVYAGVDVRTGARVAIKLERITAECPQLLYESRILHELQGEIGIPRRYWFGQQDGFNVLIMQRLGKCLVDIELMTVPMVCDIATQILARLQVIHTAGFAYRDMKPDNFVFGTGSCKNILYIIDFGLCKRVVDTRTGEHIHHRTGKQMSGTPRYVSLRTHDGEEQSRRDDIEALGYMLVYLVKGRLPWQGLPSKHNYISIANTKKSTNLMDLCEGLPHAFQKTIEYARGLSFPAMPDYAYLRSLWSCTNTISEH